MPKYTIGLDFGTLSGRALLVDTSNGREIADSVMSYPHAVMDEYLPGSDVRLPQSTALQHPQDYLDVAEFIIRDVIQKAKVDKKDVIGISIDFTTCTILPIREDGTPLCFEEKYRLNPYAYAKLWKDHSSQPYADRITEAAIARHEPWLERCGGKVSSEWMFPKVWQMLDKDPELYKDCDLIIEAGDWMTFILTGRYTKSYAYAASKALYFPECGGYPSEEFWACLDERLRHVVKDKMDAPVLEICEMAGRVTAEAAQRFGLCEGTAVGVPHPDAHVAPPALNMRHEGDMCAVFGTSSCYMLIGHKDAVAKGTCGTSKDILMPGFYGYESGLCCVGDLFAWLCDNLAPAEYKEEAQKLGIPLIRYIIGKAAKQAPGEHGLIALDWWNGNRNVIVDSELTGLLIGMDLRTRAEDILRALIEATAFATKVIIDTFAEHEIPVKRIIACGGIARKDPFTMQLYADVLNVEIGIAGSSQIPALASAIFASVAAGSSAGGYDDIYEASAHMSNVSDIKYTPDPEAHRVYMQLYEEYKRLHDYFGRGENDVMKRLLAIKAQSSRKQK